ncbi:MAG: hypothetical protein GY726_16490, partial [Proteobacteria bacterium]|nr:hypothetical protein [Pseudomonadota bacterium]
PSLSAADIARLLEENALLKQQLDTLLSPPSDPKPTGGLTGEPTGGLTSAYKEEQFDPKLFEQQQNSNTEQKPDPVVVGNINALSQEVKNLKHEFPGVICNINEHNLATWAAGYNPDYITTGIRYAFLQSKHGTEPVRNMGAYINTTLPASDRETLQAMIDELSQCMPPYLRKTTAPPPPRSGYVPPNTVSAADPNPQPTHRVTLGALAAGIGDGMPQTPNERDRRRMLSGQAAQFRAQDGAKSD